MNPDDAFERILGLLHQAALDDVHWSAVSAAIDESCGAVGNALVVGDRSGDIHFIQPLYRGEANWEVAREYLENYYPHDEVMRRRMASADGRLLHMSEIYSETELKTSVAYNEGQRLMRAQDGINVCFGEPMLQGEGSSTASPLVPLLADGPPAFRGDQVMNMFRNRTARPPSHPPGSPSTIPKAGNGTDVPRRCLCSYSQTQEFPKSSRDFDPDSGRASQSHDRACGRKAGRAAGTRGHDTRVAMAGNGRHSGRPHRNARMPGVYRSVFLPCLSVCRSVYRLTTGGA